MESSLKGKVLVTGASGFIAGQIIFYLLDNDYQVFGSVRSLKDKKKTEYIYQIHSQKGQNLTLVEADLNDKESWNKVMPGMDYVMHVASPFPSKPVKNEMEIITPALEGTQNVLNAAIAHGVKKIVLTSSVAAIYPGHPKDKFEFTEDDWAILNDPKNPITTYEKSKYLAEKEAWKIWNDKKGQFELAVINPSLVIGPRFGGNDFTSGDIIMKLMNNQYPGMPKIQFGLVDVRDVALAHLRALENKASDGHRFILSSDSLWFKDIALTLHNEFSKKGYKIPKREFKGCLVKFASVFDSQVKLIIPMLGKRIILDHKKAENQLGISFIPPQKSLIEMAYDLIEKGYIKKR